MSFLPGLRIGVWNAWIFMSVFLIQMLIIMLTGEKTRRRSHVSRDARISTLDKYAGMAGNLVWFTALVYSVLLPLWIGSLWFFIGLSVFAAGSIILAIATADFITTPLDQLISKGVYRFSRHPMYLATFLICLGTGFAAGSWLFILLTVILALCFHQEALIEERFCLEQYGDAYREYLNSVARWIRIP